MDALLLILIVGALGIAIAYYAIREDKQDKEIQRMINNAIDRDGDGVILEGTPFERKVVKPVKKAPAKKKPVAKAKPAAKTKAKPVAKKKSATAAKPKKKAVAKKKSR